jgi:hypothetical protein
MATHWLGSARCTLASAKDLVIKPIAKADADRIVKSLHYSGKVVKNSVLHLGVFLDGKCGGALQFGPSLDKSKLIGLVEGTPWNGFVELNRMALADWLPKNGESRCISIAMKLIKKHYPEIQWVVSFADGCSCGHGTIYQASGFHLTGIVPNKNLARLPTGETIHKMTLESNPDSPRPEAGGRSYYSITGGKYNWAKYVEAVGATILDGFQLRYIYFLDPTAKERITVPTIPFSKIEEMGATMYRGQVLSTAD